jgi:hypothetical protein
MKVSHALEVDITLAMIALGVILILGVVAMYGCRHRRNNSEDTPELQAERRHRQCLLIGSLVSLWIIVYYFIEKPFMASLMEQVDSRPV